MSQTTRETLSRLQGNIEQGIVHQRAVVQRLLLTLLCEEHLLLKGRRGWPRPGQSRRFIGRQLLWPVPEDSALRSKSEGR